MLLPKNGCETASVLESARDEATEFEEIAWTSAKGIGLEWRTKHAYSCLTTIPLFMTKLTCSSRRGLVRGSPGTAIKSALRPGETAPIRSLRPNKSLAGAQHLRFDTTHCKDQYGLAEHYCVVEFSGCLAAWSIPRASNAVGETRSLPAHALIRGRGADPATRSTTPARRYAPRPWRD